MSAERRILGIDAGSVTLCLVEFTASGDLVRQVSISHEGKVLEALTEALACTDASSFAGIACTSSTPPLIEGASWYDSNVACITAAKRFHPGVRSLLLAGGEKFSLIRFDPDGNYLGMKSNSPCAAGTGGFLDQQARRLGLGGPVELAEMALRSVAPPPAVASRCSVFAKTDLIHAQQEGFAIEEICDGLCLGVARNILDAVLGGRKAEAPVVFAGGVSRNAAVVRHVEGILGCSVIVDSVSHLYGALGAGLCRIAELRAMAATTGPVGRGSGWAPVVEAAAIRPATSPGNAREYAYPHLALTLSAYPEFTGEESYLFPDAKAPNPVEVDIYERIERGQVRAVFLGIDVGSMSTKAVLVDEDRKVLAGMYTRTAGAPLAALQGILRSASDLLERRLARVEVLGAATTGAGRKFIGTLMGADCILDEITAHAKAACELDPDVDTIIEIGGQDSKFTTLHDGIVTSSTMNTVCAAGTGSFLEEQAAKLGVPLGEFSGRALGVPVPLASDRCTVFMERDINHLLNRGYSVDEVLAACLVSVRENYLRKVATEKAIGAQVCFQGATAKNRALVAAFETRLGKSIFVSRYCHLTGALGAALTVLEERPRRSAFRGLDIWREEIPVRSETCRLCDNRCRLRIATIRGEELAYGFLCGRDYGTPRYVARSGGAADAVVEWGRAFGGAGTPEDGREAGAGLTIGIPSVLPLLEELPFWKRFFAQLSLKVVTSEGLHTSLKAGKELTGAEFCAPVTALHGHVRYLLERADRIFLPIYLSAIEPGGNVDSEPPLYCYYTQWSSAIVSLMEGAERDRCLLPLIDAGSGSSGRIEELFRVLSGIPGLHLDRRSISRAHSGAGAFVEMAKRDLQERFLRSRERREDIEVILLGRPYTVLSPELNKGIPAILAGMGVPSAYHGMIPVPKDVSKEIEPLLDAFPWKYAKEILRSAAYCAREPNLYPVMVTCFKCAPDSFILEYFKRILDAHAKPYLILQVDEHDSSVGYETRLEAAVRAFRNHARGTAALARSSSRIASAEARAWKPTIPMATNLRDKTVLIPRIDPFSSPLVVANLRRAGIDARVLHEDGGTIRRSMALNTGQCIPLNAIVQGCIDTIERESLDPGKAVMWMARGRLACNLPLFPYHMKCLLESHGNGMEKAEVYVGDMTHLEISPLITIRTYFAYHFGGLLRKIGCQIRPYEKVPGQTDRAIAEGLEILTEAFLGKRPQRKAIEEVARLLGPIPIRKHPRPKVAIFGDIYVRDNPAMNQDLIGAIERAGGEVITTPYSDYLKIISSAYFGKWTQEGSYLTWLTNRSLLAAVGALETKYKKTLEAYHRPVAPMPFREVQRILARFHLRIQHDGESFDNLLKVHHIVNEHPDVALFVQASPAFCCPALVTEAMGRDIERSTGVPVLTVTYDGTGSFKNDVVVPFVKYRRNPSPRAD